MIETDQQGPWDAIILGGALAGASAALLLLRRNPRHRVLIVEKTARFGRKVGESTVEISAFFLGRVLGLTDHLNDRHLTKQGMRFWFSNEQTRNLGDCSETGPAYNVRFPGYQVDRSILDEEVLARAVAAGARLERPVKVRDVTLVSGGLQTVEWESDSGPLVRAQARWVIDASGVAAVLARKNGWLETNRDHPITACWSRWTGVKNWDARDLAEKYPAWSQRVRAVRYTATNHIVGRGWWSWWIPLKGGDTSVGLVYDQRLVELPPGDSIGGRLKAFLRQNPAACELLEKAQYKEGDVHFRRNCAYRSKVYAGDGFALVGDAAAFLDPFYSPGMDWISFSSTCAAALVDSCLAGRSAGERVDRYNRHFSTAYDRWFDAVYRDKYYYMGDYEIMTLAFRLDLGHYSAGVVSQPFSRGERALETPAFCRPGAGGAAAFMALYNRRLVAIARSRWKRGTWGRRNSGLYYPFISYELNRWLFPRIAFAVAGWIALEMKEGWRTWLSRPEGAASAAPEFPAAEPAPAEV